MEKLEYEGRTFYFEVEEVDGSSYGWYYTTIFYTKLEDKLVKKYWLFGPLVPAPNYKEVFTIDGDIKNPEYSKEKVRKLIKEKVDLLTRKEEIDKGDLI